MRAPPISRRPRSSWTRKRSRNLDTMSAALPGARLRPHVKAHKCTALAREQASRGHRRIHVRDARELLGLAHAGLTDNLLLANESVADDRLRSMADCGARVTVAVDSEATIDAAAQRHPRGARRCERRHPALRRARRRRGRARRRRPGARAHRARHDGLRRPRGARFRPPGAGGAHGHLDGDTRTRTKRSAARSCRAAGPAPTRSIPSPPRSRPVRTR